MTIFLQYLGNCVAKAIIKSFIIPEGNKDTWSDITVKKFEANAKAHFAILQALNNNVISRVVNYTSAYDFWKILIITQEDTTQLKKAKIDFLNSQYDRFYMLVGESIDDMLTQFITITNVLISLGKTISNDQKVRKIIRTLLKS